MKVEKNISESEIRPCDLVCLGDTDNVEEENYRGALKEPSEVV